jgi:hypothetical protein
MLSEGFWSIAKMRLVAVLVAMVSCLTAAVWLERPASAAEFLVDHKSDLLVAEADSDVDTRLHIRTGDRLVVKADGQIWSGVWGAGNNGPKGWNNTDCDRKFPLPCSYPYSLLGKIGGGSYFYIGDSYDKVHAGNSGRLYLRINDDSPGGGSGSFRADIEVYRNVAPPETTITSGPLGTVQTDSAQFSFSGSSSEGAVAYECNLDDGGFAPCSSPKSFGSLSDGSHEFKVRAKDSFGQVDPTPASRTWHVDTEMGDPTPPTIGPVKPASGSKTRDRTPLISAVVRDTQTDLTQANIQLVVDGGAKSFAYNTDTDQLVYQSGRLAYGKHSVTVRATDDQGNTATKTWSFTVIRRR